MRVMIPRASSRFAATSRPYPLSVCNISSGMPQTPSGGGSIDPPIRPCPSLRISLNALRSSASTSARLMSGLSNGGSSRLMIRFVLTLVRRMTQSASGSCRLISRSNGTETSVGYVMSNVPDTNPSIRVARLGTIRYSIASRYGKPGFQ